MRPEVSAHVVATEKYLLERSEAFKFEGKLILGPGIGNRARWFTCPAETASVCDFVFEDVVLDTPVGVLLKGTDAIAETKYLVAEQHYEDATILTDRLIETHPNRKYILGRNNGFRNYYHWLIQIIPAIDACMRRSTERPTLVIPELEPWQKRTLELLELPEYDTLTIHNARQYKFGSIEFSEHLNGSTSFKICKGTIETLHRMRSKISEPASPFPAFLYVTRKDSTLRRLINEAELIEVLTKIGATVFTCSDHSIDEQIAAFRSARLIVAPHGAALSNLAFCDPGVTVFELFPDHYVNTCMSRLAQSVGADYYADAFRSHDMEEMGEHARSWEVDVERVAELVNSLRVQTKISDGGLKALERTSGARVAESASMERCGLASLSIQQQFKIEEALRLYRGMASVSIAPFSGPCAMQKAWELGGILRRAGAVVTMEAPLGRERQELEWELILPLVPDSMGLALYAALMETELIKNVTLNTEGPMNVSARIIVS